MGEVILEANKLTKLYGDHAALNNVDMQLKQGQIYGLVGKNGAGKTTFLRIVAGQTYASSGGMALFGATSEGELNGQRKRIGTIIETPSFYPYLTARQNLEYYRIQRGVPGKECVDEALHEVGLSNAHNKKYKSFSLGMKQRLGIALALLNKPELLLLDEPINGLDPLGIVEIRNLLIKLNHEKNITILISSHILTELTNLVHYYGFIEKGSMVKQISEQELSKECNRYLEVKVDKVEDMAVLLETKLNCHAYKITPDYSIHVYDYLQDPAIISKLAVTNGIGLNQIGVKDINLENYFIQLVGGANHE